MNIHKDRTGENCPFCNEGKLYPTGYIYEILDDKKESGETGRSEREYECDKCKKRTNAVGIRIKESIGNIRTSASGKANP